MNANEINQVENMAREGAREAEKSGKDWMNYVGSHPLQSMIFGITIYYAIKGFFSK